jgi:hypothetical protein
MPSERSPFVQALTAATLIAAFAVPQNIFAQASEHVVSPSDLQKAVVNASQARQHNVETLQAFFSSDEARRALESTHMNPAQVKSAVASLSDEELAQLSARTKKAQADFAAGNISDRDLLIILVAIAALILIIVAVR